MANVEMVIHEVRVSTINNRRVVILREREGARYLPIWVSDDEADAIVVKTQNISLPRPMTHDFMCAAIDSLGGSLDSVVIDELGDDALSAKAILRAQKEQKVVDCRPGDALAVAVRKGVTIFATGAVLDKAGLVID